MFANEKFNNITIHSNKILKRNQHNNYEFLENYNNIISYDRRDIRSEYPKRKLLKKMEEKKNSIEKKRNSISIEKNYVKHYYMNSTNKLDCFNDVKIVNIY